MDLIEKCADCGEVLGEMERVVIESDFIVHKTCLEAVETEWKETKAELIAAGHQIPCKWIQEKQNDGE